MRRMHKVKTNNIHTHVAAVVLTPLTIHAQLQAMRSIRTAIFMKFISSQVIRCFHIFTAMIFFKLYTYVPEVTGFSIH